MRTAPLSISIALAVAALGATASAQQQQQQPQPGAGQGVQPAPWRKFPTGLGGVPAGTAPANPGSMLDRTPTRNRFPVQPAPSAPTTPAIGNGPGFNGFPFGAQSLTNRPYYVITTPDFRFGGRTLNFGDISPGQTYRSGLGLDAFGGGYGAFRPLGGAILRRYGGETLDFGIRLTTPALSGCAPQPSFIVPPTFRGSYSGWTDAWRRWDDDWQAYSFVGNVSGDSFRPTAPPSAPPSEPARPPAPLTTMQQAAEALQRGDATAAASFFQQRLIENDNDALAQRGLALALLEQRKLEQAIAVLGQTYVKYPWLAGLPIPASSLPGGERDLRSRFNSVMTYANRTNTSSSLLSAAIFAQAEDRPEVALKLIDRAEAAGLDAPVVAALRTALGK